jgi:arylsulfatase A-like enzyme
MLFALLAVLCLPAFGFDASTPAAQRNAILFSWDGVQREHIMECLSRNELPNLAALIAEGHVVNIDVTAHQTATKAGHAQMLTGYDPDITGTYTNMKFMAIPKGLSIFERLEKAFGDDGIATIMVTGSLHNVGACPPATHAEIAQAKAELAKMGNASDPDMREKWTTTIERPGGEPFYFARKNMDRWEGENRRYNEVMGPIMIESLDQYGKSRFFAFYHLIDADHQAHGFGENSKEYNDSIIVCDKWLGEMVKKLKALGVYERTMVFVTSDHGFDEGAKGHSNAPRVFLAGNLATLTKNGDQRDITPTLLTEMGVDVSTLRPKYKGAVLTTR